jgi:monoterpene epsilon-lactone hydrolase
MPSRTHDLLARAVPRVRGSRDLDTEPAERERVERWHAGLDRSFPSRLVPFFDRRFSVVTEDLAGFPVHVMTPRGTRPERTVLHLHGGGYMAPLDPFHVRFLARLARDLGARVVVPDYPLAPEHTWRDSFDPLVGLVSRWADPATGGRLTLSGDSAGGGYALALAGAVRDRGGPQPDELLLLSPWVDLTTSTPETEAYDAVDPWLFLGKLRAYARWWAGSDDDLARAEVSPGLGDLAGLPRALVLCGTRDLLLPGCRLLACRAAATDWDLTYVEEPDLLHVYPLLPLVPEARRARRTIGEFLR